ncbi:Mercuric transport protein periplasmic component [Crenothrix polyspora]|uniref:Mercuric transport protein periplasmic component n=1 Tax=Crenothrix polyspora TaxID=360316 RepID=A0A1R4H0K7_9GAMM|nr:cation transporter [Crenothrix polyspora]SJM89379.1 Mercuric transport protein periplasmic component [Crenothrix polyspora]
MKNFIFLLLLAQSGFLFAGEQSVVLFIPSMDCPVCPITIKKSLQKVVGVKAVDVSYESKTAAVVFDDQLSGLPDLLKATENVGYPSSLQDGKK